MNRGNSTMTRIDPLFKNLLNDVKTNFLSKGIRLSDTTASKIIAIRMKPMMFDIDFQKENKRKKSGRITLKYEDLE